MISLAYGLYMAESEGYLDTRTSKINRVIRAIRACAEEEISESAFRRILEHEDIDPDSLTEKELNIILKGIK